MVLHSPCLLLMMNQNWYLSWLCQSITLKPFSKPFQYFLLKEWTLNICRRSGLWRINVAVTQWLVKMCKWRNTEGFENCRAFNAVWQDWRWRVMWIIVNVFVVAYTAKVFFFFVSFMCTGHRVYLFGLCVHVFVLENYNVFKSFYNNIYYYSLIIRNNWLIYIYCKYLLT